MRRIVLYGEARRAGDWGGLGIEREMAIDYSRDHREINKLEEACWPNNYIMLGGCAHISYPDLSIEEGGADCIQMVFREQGDRVTDQTRELRVLIL